MSKKKKFHVSYSNPGDEILVTKIIAKLLPRKIIKKLVLKMNSPVKRPLDIYDVYKENPNEIVEVEKDKVWMVRYKTGGFFKPKGVGIFGLTSDSKNYDKIMEAATLEGNEAVEQAKKDWNSLLKYNEIDEDVGEKGEYLKQQSFEIFMVVVKLTSGDILLYCPIPVHDETPLDKWLKELGPVKYLVIGSCGHTLFLPATTARFPEAIVIGTTPAEEKLKSVNALFRGKLDYDVLDESCLKQLNDILKSEGVTLKYIKGDVAYHSIFLVAYNTGIECDLMYGHNDECQCDFCNEQGMFENIKSDERHFFVRLVHWRLMTKPNSPNGFLPTYRFSLMDPSSTLSTFSWKRPANDGSSCSDMANSLREILGLRFENVITVHWGKISKDDFKNSVNNSWEWLDGSSLLP